MSAYRAPSGTVYERDWERGDPFMFIVLDGYDFLDGLRARRAFHVEQNRVTCFVAGTSWDLHSREVK